MSSSSKLRPALKQRIADLTKRRDALRAKLLNGLDRMKRHQVEHDLLHIGLIDKTIEAAERRLEAGQQNIRRIALSLIGLVVIVVTLLLMQTRPQEGDLTLDVVSRALSFELLGAGGPTVLALEMDAMTVEPIATASLGSLTLEAASLDIEDGNRDGEHHSLQSITAPAGTSWTISTELSPRIGLRLVPPPTGSLELRVNVPSTSMPEFETDDEPKASRIREALAQSQYRTRLILRTPPGVPVGITVGLTDAFMARLAGEELNFAGLSGVPMGELDFLDLDSADSEGVRVRSHVVRGKCRVERRESDVELMLSDVLVSESWSGTCTSIGIVGDGVRLQWQGEALRPRSGHPYDPSLLLPVWFEILFGQSPLAYFSLILCYASLIPIFVVLRWIRGIGDEVNPLDITFED